MERSTTSVTGSESLEKGLLFSCEFDSTKQMLEYIDSINHTTDEHIVFLSRLPHRRLLDQLDISKIETYWMTHRVGQAHIAPDLKAIHDLIQSRISHHHGVIVLEGLEWLVTLHGESTILNFIRTLRDEIHRTQWMLILSLEPLAFNSIWLARLRREAPLMEVHLDVADQIESEVEPEDEDNAAEHIPVTEEGLPSLVMLNRLPKNGFTHALLRKRVLQWRRMGLDVSEVEPALHQALDDAFVLYTTVESKVRVAVELERRIDSVSEHLNASELTTSKFRIRQLTGLEDIERMLDSI
jgi:hypothetical protein